MYCVPTIWLRPATLLSSIHEIYSSPHLPVIPAQLMRPGILAKMCNAQLVTSPQSEMPIILYVSYCLCKNVYSLVTCAALTTSLNTPDSKVDDDVPTPHCGECVVAGTC